MVEVPIIIVILIGIALTAVIWIEANEYRKYQKAAKSLIAYSEGMKIIIEQVGENMGKFHVTQSLLIDNLQDKDRDIRVLYDIVNTHTDILQLKMLAGLNSKGVTEDGEGE